jgi:hypothetical protein
MRLITTPILVAATAFALAATAAASPNALASSRSTEQTSSLPAYAAAKRWPAPLRAKIWAYWMHGCTGGGVPTRTCACGLNYLEQHYSVQQVLHLTDAKLATIARAALNAC